MSLQFVDFHFLVCVKTCSHQFIHSLNRKFLRLRVRNEHFNDLVCVHGPVDQMFSALVQPGETLVVEGA